tara:strand:+ start:5126 stop:5398 length:273 start_codon:yes stop_codon:yes gene_type:complete
MTWENIDGIFLPNHRCGCGSINITAAVYRTERLARMLADVNLSPIEREDLRMDMMGMMSDMNKVVNDEWEKCQCNFGLLAINQTGFAKSI